MSPKAKIIKPKIGVFSITGCAGCQLSLIFNEDELLHLLDLIDLHAFPFIKEVNPELKYDYVLMEGLVATKEDFDTLKKIRQNTKFLVALGSCAHTGCIPAYRNFTLERKYQKTYHHTIKDIKNNLKSIKPTPIADHVPVDYTIPGCPPEKREILDFIDKISQRILPSPYTEPVCFECRKLGNPCLLEQNKPCLGPITTGGCHAVCPSGGFECWGCRGQTKDANLKIFKKLLKDKGFKKDFIEKRMRTFVGNILTD